MRWIYLTLLAMGAVCLTVGLAAAWVSAEDDDYRRVLRDTEIYWGAGETLPDVGVSLGSCSTRGHRGSGGRHSSDLRYSECSVFLKGAIEAFSTRERQWEVQLFRLDGKLEPTDVHGVVRWRDQIGIRWSFATMLSRWLELIHRLWVIPLVCGIGIFLALCPLWLRRREGQQHGSGSS